MATAIATVTINAFPSGVDYTKKSVIVRGTIAVQASPATYATGGLSLNFNVLQPVTNFAIETLSGPSQVFIDSGAGGLYEYGWNKANNALQIFAASAGVAGSAPFVEFANATAIPASVSGDTIYFEAVFPRNM